MTAARYRSGNRKESMRANGDAIKTLERRKSTFEKSHNGAVSETRKTGTSIFHHPSKVLFLRSTGRRNNGTKKLPGRGRRGNRCSVRQRAVVGSETGGGNR